MNPTWIYHPEHPAKIVSEDEAKVLYREGWFDTPAKFPGKTLEAQIDSSVEKVMDLPKRKGRSKAPHAAEA
jgi:hypothetical protein